MVKKPKVGSRWTRINYNKSLGVYHAYTVLYITNTAHVHSRHPEQVVYEGDNGHIWSCPLCNWPANLIPETDNNSAIIGKKIKIHNPNVITNGMVGHVEKFHQDSGKYKVGFEPGWCGYYTRKELQLI